LIDVNTVPQTPENIQESRTWRPDQGDVNPLTGRLEDVASVTNEWGTYPLAMIVDEMGCSWGFHAFREVAKQELAELAPEIGDVVTVNWLGVPEDKKYHVYKIRFADGRGRGVDWTKFGGTEGADLRAADPPASDDELAAIEPDADELPY
jgi:hypothetical protein